MHDFFSVLDEFEFEEFVASEADEGSSFNFDETEGDSSGIPVPGPDGEEEVALNAVETKAEDITEAGQTVWANEDNPFSGSTGGVVLGLDTSKTKSYESGGGKEGNLAYTEISLSAVKSLTFTKTKGSASSNTKLQITRPSGAISGISGSAGLNVDLSAGRVTGGFFAEAANVFVKLWNDLRNANGDYITDDDAPVYLALEGFGDDVTEDNCKFTSDGSDLKSVTVPPTEDATVTVNGDTKFTLNGKEVKIANVDLTEDNSADYIFTYDEDLNITLDVSALVAEENETIDVKAAGGADYIVPGQTGADATADIRIAGTTYTYTSVNGKAYFALDDNEAVTGFVLVNTGDAITVNNSNEIAVYDEDISDVTKLVDVSGKSYTITKTGTDTYSATVTESSTVTIGDTKFVFDITKANNKAVEITFEDGEVTGVQATTLTATDSMTVTGATATSADGGIQLLTNTGAVAGNVAINTGAFTYYGGATPKVYVADGVTVYAVGGVANTQVFVGEDGVGGTITNNGSEYTYKSTGDAYFVADATSVFTKFVFAGEGDKVTLPTSNAIPVEFSDETVRIPTVTDSDKSFTVELTDADAGEFTIEALSEGSTVEDDTVEVTFTNNSNGKVTFDETGIIGIYNYTGDLTFDADDDPIVVNGNILVFNQDVTVTSKDGTGVETVSGLTTGAVVVSVDEETGADTSTVFEFETDGGTDTFTVNGKVYTVKNDADGVKISADGKVTDLDDGAVVDITPIATNETVYVNGKPYDYTVDGDDITGFQTRKGELSSYPYDPTHPIFGTATATDTIEDALFGDTHTFTNDEKESDQDDATLVDFSTVDGSAKYTFDTSGDDAVTFGNDGKNLAIVQETATGNKSITMGDQGDGVIMEGVSENGSVNITTGAGNDTIVVRGNQAEDSVFRGGSMETTIDMGSEGIDKVITYAAANANITLTNYDVTGKSGVVFHDPELGYIKEEIKGAIEDGLLVFEDDSIIAIDRDEAKKGGALPEGTDRKTQIKVENVATNPSTMVRLFGYKDASDGYSDDFGQVVGFTNEAGGTIDASSFKEEVVLVGNYSGNKTGGSVLIGGDYNDTLFGGAGDSINAGGGVNNIVLDDDVNRDAAVINAASGYVSIDNINYDDVIDVTNHTDNIALAFEDGVLGFVDVATKTTIEANVDETWKELGFVRQTFVDGNTELKTAIAESGKSITVTDDYEPNYFSAYNGGIDFRNYTGDVGIDVDGLDNDWSGPNYVGSSGNITIGSGLDSLFGGSGTTIFKGGADDETLVAGSGESSLYGAGGSNVLKAFEGTKNGSTEFFVIGIHNGAQNRIEGFEAIADGGANQATFDALNLGLADGNDVTGVSVSGGSDVVIAVKGEESGATETATIVGAAGSEILIDRGTETETVAQIAASVVTIKNDYVDFYEATETNAIVSVGSGVSEARVWLESPEHNGVNGNENHTEYVGDFSVIDASGSGASVELAGNDAANTILGGSGNASMWGGSGSANDLMVAGTAHNEFYYEVGNGNDTIQGGNDGDIIHLGMSLDQIDFDGTQMNNSAIVVKFVDGGTLNVNNGAEVTFSFDDGTNVKANRQTGQFE